MFTQSCKNHHSLSNFSVRDPGRTDNYCDLTSRHYAIEGTNRGAEQWRRVRGAGSITG